MKKTMLSSVICLSAGAAAFYSGSVLAAPEVEPNNTITAPQVIPSNSGTQTIEGVIGSIGGSAEDADFYTFNAKAGDKLSFRIENGLVGQESVMTVLTLFGTRNQLLRVVEANSGDPALYNFVMPSDGNYTIAVTNYPRYLMSGGGFELTVADLNYYADLGYLDPSQITDNGDYTLVVDGFVADNPIINVALDIRPGSDKTTPVNPKSRGKLKVAVLSSDAFDPNSIDVSTVRFGQTGEEDSIYKCMPSMDLNGDSVADLICMFKTSMTGITFDDTSVSLTAKTVDGADVVGEGEIVSVPASFMSRLK